MILAALVYIRKVTETTTVSEVTEQYLQEGHAHILQHKEIPSFVAIFRIHGPFLFGATDKINVVIDRIPDLPPIIILRLRNMTALDGTGLQALENLADVVHNSGRTLLLCGGRQQPAEIMRNAEFEQRVGAENICASVAEALQQARKLWSLRAERGPAATPSEQEQPAHSR
jgi:SulP family sulfate permease